MVELWSVGETRQEMKVRLQTSAVLQAESGHGQQSLLEQGRAWSEGVPRRSGSRFQVTPADVQHYHSWAEPETPQPPAVFRCRTDRGGWGGLDFSCRHSNPYWFSLWKLVPHVSRGMCLSSRMSSLSANKRFIQLVWSVRRRSGSALQVFTYLGGCFSACRLLLAAALTETLLRFLSVRSANHQASG